MNEYLVLWNNNYFHFLHRILQLIFSHYPIHCQSKKTEDEEISFEIFCQPMLDFTLYELS